MPKNDVLYCKGMRMDHSESDGEELNHDDKWDDTLLNSAYDRALKMANVEVAKRLAMATNSNEDKGRSKSQHTSKKQGKRKQWSEGMPCRAVYEEDGLEYEAFVVDILNNKECIVKFLGYDNTEQVDMDTIKPSLGKEAQRRQIEQAIVERGEESDVSASNGSDEMKSDRRQSPANTERSYYKKDQRKKNKQSRSHNFHLPDVPMPDMDKLRNMTSKDIPFPMPPPLQLPSRSDLANEDHAVSSMLLAWYMSGYYTGVYQGLKRSKLSKRQRDYE